MSIKWLKMVVCSKIQKDVKRDFPHWQCGGQGFKSPMLHHFISRKSFCRLDLRGFVFFKIMDFGDFVL